MSPVRVFGRPACVPFLVALALLCGGAPCAAQKTDIIVLASGDKLTAEIKGMSLGYLEANTDSMSHVDIVWVDVVQISSPHHFSVSLTSGDEYIGTLRSPTPGQLEIVGPEGAVIETVALIDVVELRQARLHFFDRIDGTLGLGFNVARANDQRSWNLDADVEYSGERWHALASASSSFSSQEGADSTSRNELTVQPGRKLAGRWFYAGVLRLEQNEELGLMFRTGLGGGVGRRLVENNRRVFQLLGGLMVTRERFEGRQPRRTSRRSSSVATTASGGGPRSWTPRSRSASFRVSPIPAGSGPSSTFRRRSRSSRASMSGSRRSTRSTAAHPTPR